MRHYVTCACGANFDYVQHGALHVPGALEEAVRCPVGHLFLPRRPVGAVLDVHLRHVGLRTEGPLRMTVGPICLVRGPSWATVNRSTPYMGLPFAVELVAVAWRSAVEPEAMWFDTLSRRFALSDFRHERDDEGFRFPPGEVVMPVLTASCGVTFDFPSAPEAPCVDVFGTAVRAVALG